MEKFCNCTDWEDLKKNNTNIFQWDPAYGWVLHWIELTEETGYTQVHRYGIPIKFCPMCGKKLKNSH
jgi:hypothetical protein